MNKLSKSILAIFAIVILNFPAFIAAETSPSIFKLLNQVYGNYDAKRECWVVPIKEAFESHYCMEITKSDIIHTKSGKRNYLLLTSDVLDNKSGQANGSHADAGKVGLFIIKLKGTKLLAAEPEIPLGSWGRVPEKWNLIKLAPSDYWGWQTNSVYSNHGHYHNLYTIFAPYGKNSIKELTTILVDYNNGGVVEGYTEIAAEIKVDNLQVDKRVFPLKVKVTGKINGKKLKVKTWELPFDTRKWRYTEPKNWPLSDF